MRSAYPSYSATQLPFGPGQSSLSGQTPQGPIGAAFRSRQNVPPSQALPGSASTDSIPAILSSGPSFFSTPTKPPTAVRSVSPNSTAQLATPDPYAKYRTSSHTATVSTAGFTGATAASFSTLSARDDSENTSVSAISCLFRGTPLIPVAKDPAPVTFLRSPQDARVSGTTPVKSTAHPKHSERSPSRSLYSSRPDDSAKDDAENRRGRSLFEYFSPSRPFGWVRAMDSTGFEPQDYAQSVPNAFDYTARNESAVPRSLGADYGESQSSCSSAAASPDFPPQMTAEATADPYGFAFQHSRLADSYHSSYIASQGYGQSSSQRVYDAASDRVYEQPRSSGLRPLEGKSHAWDYDHESLYGNNPNVASAFPMQGRSGDARLYGSLNESSTSHHDLYQKAPGFSSSSDYRAKYSASFVPDVGDLRKREETEGFYYGHGKSALSATSHSFHTAADAEFSLPRSAFPQTQSQSQSQPRQSQFAVQPSVDLYAQHASYPTPRGNGYQSTVGNQHHNVVSASSSSSLYANQTKQPVAQNQQKYGHAANQPYPQHLAMAPNVHTNQQSSAHGHGNPGYIAQQPIMDKGYQSLHFGHHQHQYVLPEYHSGTARPRSQEFAEQSLHYQQQNMPANVPLCRRPPYQTELKKPADEIPRKKSDVHDSPPSKQMLKDLTKTLKSKENFEAASSYLEEVISDIPVHLRWKLYIELADMAKRDNNLREARRLYNDITSIQPDAVQGWLEFSKLEEENGRMSRCEAILKQGLDKSEFNENLVIKLIKHEERIGKLDEARKIFARVRPKLTEKSWKIVLEGALLESRAGNDDAARRIFDNLMKTVPWYGPVYHEAYKFEERCGDNLRALHLVERGLKKIPRYGPLWFAVFRLYEKVKKDPESARAAYAESVACISKELVWKVYYELAQMEERLSGKCEGPLIDAARAAYVESLYHCPTNLRWKVWLGGARTEMVIGNVEKARLLLDRSMDEVPPKMKALVYLEKARLEEYCHDISKARSILEDARTYCKQEWKVYLESILLEIRSGDIAKAIECTEEALKIHPGTGRLWAMYIQLMLHLDEEEQLRVFYEAVREVPKSGEVWCEGARILMNPLSKHFSLHLAKRFLDFAVQFTPQYGDSFIEYIRLELLMKGLNADLSVLERICANADPNYGSMWFYCKNEPLDTTTETFATARRLVVNDLIAFWRVYQPSLVEESGTFSFNFKPANVKSKRGIPPGIETTDFGTGLVSLNRVHKQTKPLSDEDRYKLIFGCDSIVP